jgi:hypothetical protein
MWPVPQTLSPDQNATRYLVTAASAQASRAGAEPWVHCQEEQRSIRLLRSQPNHLPLISFGNMTYGEVGRCDNSHPVTTHQDLGRSRLALAAVQAVAAAQHMAHEPAAHTIPVVLLHQDHVC